MIDHIGIYVDNLEKSKEFYLQALTPLGISVIMDFPSAVGIGMPPDKAFFWIMKSGEKEVNKDVHIAFLSPNRANVDAFYNAALKSGGKDNGAPGIRANYHPNYYAAFVSDPDGNNVEVVCHTPE